MSYESAIFKLDEVIVGGGGAATIPFSSIDQRYRSLRLEGVLRGDTAAANVEMRVQFNGDTGANYNWEQFLANATQTNNGSTQINGDSALRIGYVPAATATANYAGQIEVLIANYAGTTFQKTTRADGAFQQDTGTSNHYISYHAGHWLSTAAITSILLFPASGNFIAGSTAALYGIL